MSDNWMIYGATGYTGRLIAETAKARGLKPVLAGRNGDKVRAIAEELGLPWGAFSVDDEHAVETAIKDKSLVLSVAGPFSATANQMMDACIKTGTHYLDVTGEIAVFELAANKSEAAKKANVTLIPGVGFDVVPSDCLAAHTAKRASNPQSLKLAIKGLGGPSRGTAKTGVESLGQGTSVRKNGMITKAYSKDTLRTFNFGQGDEEYLGVSWGDVSTAFYSTGIPDIEVYFPNAGPIKTMAKLSRNFGWLMRCKFVQNFLKKKIDEMPAGPSEDDRAKAGSVLLAEVVDANGAVYRSQLSCPNGYSLTADSAIKCAQHVLAGKAPTGHQTPSLAFGVELLNEVEGCTLTDC